MLRRFKRLLNRLYYLIESVLMRGTFSQLFLVALGILGLTLLGGGALELLRPDYRPDLGQSIWWAFLRLTDPGYLGDDSGTAPIVISTILTVAGYVVFLGSLVAIMTNQLTRFMDDLSAGLSPIFEQDHILIIGWNSRIHSLVEEIVHAEERVKRLLGRSRLPAVVVLTREFEPDMVQELEEKLDPSVRDECRLIVRAGNPLEAESLERVDFKRASSIILVSPYDKASNRHLADIQLVKILLSLKAETRGVEFEELPNVVLEIGNPSNKLLAERAGWTHKTEAIATEEFISRLIGHTLRNPGLSSVYNHLLTDTFGESIYLKHVHQLNLQGHTLRETVDLFDRAIPLGVLRASDDQSAKEKRLRLLNFDARLRGEDELIVVAPRLDAIQTRVETAPGSTDHEDVLVEESPEVQRVRTDEAPEKRLMFVGWSHLLNPVLRELSDYEAYFHVTIVSDLPREECRKRLRLDSDRMANMTVQCRRVAIDDPDAAEELRPEETDNIVLLSSELSDDPLMADAESIMAFQQFRQRLEHLQVPEADSPSFVIELNDEDNRDLFKFGSYHDVIMTQEINSHLLSQVGVRRALAWIYEELFTQEGPEIRLRPMKAFLGGQTSASLTFRQLQERCLADDAIAVGIRHSKPQSDGRRVHLNPKRDNPVTLRQDDQVIVVT
jgi:hypothetical protein